VDSKGILHNIATPRTPFDHVPFYNPGQPDISSTFAFLFWIGRNQARIILSGSFFGILSFACLATMPGFLGKAVQAIADHDRSTLNKWALAIIVLGAVQSFSSISRHRRGVGSWISAATRLKQIIARKASELGADLPRLVSTGEVVSVNNNDVERIARGFDNIPRLIGAIVSFFYVAILLIRSSPKIGLIVVICVPLMSLLVAPIIKPLQAREAEQRKKLSESSNLAADTVAGLRVLRGIGGEELFLARFRFASQAVRRAAVRTAMIRSLLQALQIILPGVLVLVVIIIGGNLVAEGKMNVGELLSFYGYSAFLVLPLRVLTETAQRITSATVSASRVVTLLSVKTINHWGLGESPDSTGLLKDTSSEIEVRPGELLVIVSDNPLSADTLCDRLGGYENAESVYLNQLPLTTFTRAAEKEPAILSGTIGSIFDVPNSGRIDIAHAIDAASGMDILESLDGEGLSAEVVERGRTLSGGQRQRLALARTLYVDAPITILDDPTSAVDAHTEARIAARIFELRRGMTTVVFSNSPLILDRADRVILLSNDIFQLEGSHQELLAKSAEYRALVMRGA
jgi:ABC-type multidrug transport system fused ATPase/permease subunit